MDRLLPAVDAHMCPLPSGGHLENGRSSTRYQAAHVNGKTSPLATDITLLRPRLCAPQAVRGIGAARISTASTVTRPKAMREEWSRGLWSTRGAQVSARRFRYRAVPARRLRKQEVDRVSSSGAGMADHSRPRSVGHRQARVTGPGGQVGAALSSSAANRSPVVSTSDRPQPGPVTSDHTPLTGSNERRSSPLAKVGRRPKR
jgi:hypothetical protein